MIELITGKGGNLLQVRARTVRATIDTEVRRVRRGHISLPTDCATRHPIFFIKLM
jgi:hypothetical protein